MAEIKFTVPIEVDVKLIKDWLNNNDIVPVVRCAHCVYWDRDTIQRNSNDFRSWNEAECKLLAERDPYSEINRFTEGDDYCSRGEERC